MTLAVAVVCPFPFNDDASVKKNGIVFAADTRYSYEDRPAFDRGIKIIQLGRSAACVFAGNVACAANVALHLNRVFAGTIGRYAPALLDEQIDDAVRLADETDAARGVMFDGRLAEDFKLTTGTWVRVKQDARRHPGDRSPPCRTPPP